MLKNTNESAKVVPSSTCVVAPTYSYNLLDGAQLPYMTALGLTPAVSYIPFTAGAPPARAAAAAHLAMTLPRATASLIADYNAAAAGGVDPTLSYSNTSSFTVAASPCLPMFFSSETSFQLSTSPCPSDANLTASQVTFCQS